MIALLYRIFLKKKDDPDKMSAKERERAERSAYGMLCGIVGIVLNIVLFAGKLFAGLVSGAVSIVADAFNNLSDAGSSVVTLLGFKIASQKADSEHPYGHGRFEYISALIVSAVILVMGFELAKESVSRIIHPEDADVSIITVAILVASILVKCYMAFYNSRYGKKIDSAPLKAAATDSLCDCIATGMVLVTALLAYYTSVKLDGWCGLIVSFFILYAGYSSGREAIDPLLGAPPKPEYIGKIKDIVLGFDEKVIGIHDLMIHDYGPGRQIISLHAEVPCDIDMLQAHDVIDNLEKKLAEELGCTATIHMDPIQTNDPRVKELKTKVSELVTAIDPGITVHDFRVVFGSSHTNMVFDMAVPFSCPLDEAELKARTAKLIKTAVGKKYYAVITIDREC